MKPPPLPSQIKAGPHLYSVVRKPVRGCNGLCETDKLLITIAPRLRRSKGQEICLHEALHAIWPANLPWEEKVIEALTPVLLQLLQENPELVSYLTSGRQRPKA